jgi:hypothetical protein
LESNRILEEAICTLEKLMRTAKSESVRLNAAEVILSRGWGRPTQALQIDERFLTKKLSDLTPEEIKALDERVAMIESADVVQGHPWTETREHRKWANCGRSSVMNRGNGRGWLGAHVYGCGSFGNLYSRRLAIAS